MAVVEGEAEEGGDEGEGGECLLEGAGEDVGGGRRCGFGEGEDGLGDCVAWLGSVSCGMGMAG